ncbi:MAG: nitrite/sulfite reductase [Clostridiales bacterium]|nr:nitrite/sulfite reductase [Clostridiales bacterium]
MNAELQEMIDLFREKTEQFAKGEISVKDYKGFSGAYGSYAQRGAQSSMLRLRITGGRLSKDGLKSIIGICRKYGIEKIHTTTCETIQLHDIPLDRIADVMYDAIESGFYTLGGGGDFPRNIMVSPLSGVEKGENFDVSPYADKAAEYLLSQLYKVKLPRKLKVCFSNSPENAVHATFRDLGFVSRPDGLFDVYAAGGMGNNPKMGVKVAEAVSGSKILYYIKAMIALFCKYGNYDNRAKARTRYMQDVLGDRLAAEFNARLDEAEAEGGLDIEICAEENKKPGKTAGISHRRLIEQKQDGLYAVKFHPICGVTNPDTLEKIYDTIKDMPQVSLRISPDETIYIINCDGSEAEQVLTATEGGAESDIEESVACIGASVCQQGLRDSQELLAQILKAVKPYGFPPNALPKLHISGCPSSCGTHQIGSIGFHGKGKVIDKKMYPAFSVHVGGCDLQGQERFGDELGVILTEDIPKLMVELGKAATESDVDYHEFIKAYLEKNG